MNVNDLTPDDLVSIGVMVLNDRGPETWRNMIDPEVLDVENSTLCPLGQVFGGFAAGCEALGIPMYSAMDFGFDVEWTGDANADNPDAAALNEAWRRELLA